MTTFKGYPLIDASTDNIQDKTCQTLFPMADIIMQDNAVQTVITAVNTWVKVSGTFVLGEITEQFDMPVDGRLRYIGNTTKHIHSGATLSYTGDKDDIVQFALFKNGILISGSLIEAQFTGIQVLSSAINAVHHLATNDYVELYTRNIGEVKNILVKHANIFATGIATSCGESC